MEKVLPVADFRFSFGKLAQLGDKAVYLATRDHTEVGTYGIDTAYVTNIETLTQNLKDCPSDEEYKGMIKNLTDIKDADADALRVLIREMMTRVVRVFPVTSGTYLEFNTAGMNELDDVNLIKCGNRVVRQATLNLTALSVKGVTLPMIDALKVQAKKLDDSFDAQQNKMLERKGKTLDRILLANSLYALIVELFSYGKNYWVTRNAVKYTDYVIYDTPSGNPELSGSVVTVRGTMVDRLTSQPVLEGQVILEYVDAPIIVEANGKWSKENVPVECTKMWGTALAHMTYYRGDIVMNPDEDNNFQLPMEPGADNPPPPNI